MSRPWMPLYVANYLADTGHLSGAEHGAYLLLIMHYWQKGGLPDDDVRLASIARASLEQWSGMKATIAEFFHDGWRHARIDAELAEAEEKYQKRANAGRKGGNAKSDAKQSSSNAKAGLNQLQPQPPLETTPSGVVSTAPPAGDFDRLSARLVDAADGKMQPSSAVVVGPILELIAQGVDLETDILPAIKATAARLKQTVNLSYFVGPIRDAFNRRVAAGEGLAQPKVSAIKRDEDMTPEELRAVWQKRLDFARPRREWPSWIWGPMPGQPGCRVPSDMLAPTDGKYPDGALWSDKKREAA